MISPGALNNDKPLNKSNRRLCRSSPWASPETAGEGESSQSVEWKAIQLALGVTGQCSVSALAPGWWQMPWGVVTAVAAEQLAAQR